MTKLSQIVAAGSTPVTGTQFVAVTGGTTDNLYTIDQINSFTKTNSVGGSPTQLQFNNTGFAGVTGSAVSTNGSLTLGGQTVTTSDPVLNLTQTWNASGVTFTGIKTNITNTASASGSLLADFQVGSTSRFNIVNTGAATINSSDGGGLCVNMTSPFSTASFIMGGSPTHPLQITKGTQIQGAFIANGSIVAGGTVASPTFITVYNVADSNDSGGVTNWERGTFDWTTTTNVLTIGSQKAGTGTGRYIQFVDSVVGNVMGTSRAFGVDGFVNFSNGIAISGGGGAGIGAIAGGAPVLSWSGAPACLVLSTINAGAGQCFFNYGGQARVNADFSVTSSTALTNVTGLSINLQTGRHYQFEAVLLCTDAAAGGVQASISGTATITNLIYEGYTLDANTVKGQTQATAFGTAVGSTTTTGTTPTIRIQGMINVNAGGTLTVQFAQNTSNATASVVKQGSYLIAQDIN